MTEPLQDGAWGSGLATVAGERVLDTYFPEVHLGRDGAPGGPGTRETGEPVATDERRGVRLVPVETVIGSLAEPPGDPSDAYLRLHLLSGRLIRPHEANLDGVFGVLNNVAW